MTQWTNLNRHNSFVNANPRQLPLLCEISEAAHLAQWVFWQAGLLWLACCGWLVEFKMF